MSNELVPKNPINWKEVSITFTVTLISAAIGCTIAVVVAQTLIIPHINKAKEKRSGKEAKSNG